MIIARSIGLDAWALNSEIHVIARVDWPGTSNTLFVNVFKTLRTTGGNEFNLALENFDVLSEVAQPASTKVMLLRATSNIAASLQLLDHTVFDTFNPMDIASAVYALRTARCMMSEPDVDPVRLVGLMERYHPLDLLSVGKLMFSCFCNHVIF